MFAIDAKDLYRHYSSMYGETSASSNTDVEAQRTEDSTLALRRRTRLCGFIPLPFFLSAGESKSLQSTSANTNNYGTLLSIGQAADGQGYSRLSGEDVQDRNAASKKLTAADIPRSATATPTGSKRDKSRERVAFTPPAVSNLDSMKSAQKKVKQLGPSSLSEGEQPRTVPGLPAKHAQTPKSSKSTQPPQQQIQPQTNGQVFPVQTAKQPEDVPTTSNNAVTVPNGTSSSKTYNTASGAPGWNVKSAVIANGTPSTPKQKSDCVPSPQILQRPSETPKGQVPQTNGLVSSFSQASDSTEPANNLTPELAKYLRALTLARGDPVAFLESHSIFNSRNQKSLEYDDAGSTANRAVIGVKVDGKIVASSAAAGSDQKLAKARAAFKAIEVLHVGLSSHVTTVLCS